MIWGTFYVTELHYNQWHVTHDMPYVICLLYAQNAITGLSLLCRKLVNCYKMLFELLIQGLA